MKKNIFDDPELLYHPSILSSSHIEHPRRYENVIVKFIVCAIEFVSLVLLTFCVFLGSLVACMWLHDKCHGPEKQCKKEDIPLYRDFPVLKMPTNLTDKWEPENMKKAKEYRARLE